MKKVLTLFGVLLTVSGLIFISCSSQDTTTTTKTEGTAEKGMYGEKAGQALETAKEAVIEYGEKAKEVAGTYTEKAGETLESAKEAVSSYSDKAKDTIADYGEKAKDQVYGYTAPGKEAATAESEKAAEGAMEKSGDSISDMTKKAQDAIGGLGK